MTKNVKYLLQQIGKGVLTLNDNTKIQISYEITKGLPITYTHLEPKIENGFVEVILVASESDLTKNCFTQFSESDHATLTLENGVEKKIRYHNEISEFSVAARFA